MIDLHVHTSRCRHATGTLAEYVTAASAAGVRVMAFTDHLPLPDDLNAGYTMDPGELDDYVADVGSVRELGLSCGVEVLLGVEADWLPGRPEWGAGLLRGLALDVVMGAVHFLDDWAFDDPDLVSGYEQWSARDLWERYFRELATAAHSGAYDVMAHVDLVKKFGFAPPADHQDLYLWVAGELAAAGVAVEVSTAGLRKPCAEIYPSEALLGALRRAGVPITMGSDAHAPAEVGHMWGFAVETIKRAGYESLLVFRGRVGEEVPLP